MKKLLPFFTRKKCHTAQCARNRLHASVRSSSSDMISNIKNAIIETLAQYPNIEENKVTFFTDKKKAALCVTVPLRED